MYGPLCGGCAPRAPLEICINFGPQAKLPNVNNSISQQDSWLPLFWSFGSNFKTSNVNFNANWQHKSVNGRGDVQPANQPTRQTTNRLTAIQARLTCCLVSRAKSGLALNKFSICKRACFEYSPRSLASAGGGVENGRQLSQD